MVALAVVVVVAVVAAAVVADVAAVAVVWCGEAMPQIDGVAKYRSDSNPTGAECIHELVSLMIVCLIHSFNFLLIHIYLVNLKVICSFIYRRDHYKRCGGNKSYSTPRTAHTYASFYLL